MAERLHEPLELLHVVNPGLRDLNDDSPWAWREFAEAQLELGRNRLGPLSVPIEQQILEGPPEKVLVRHVEQVGARALVLPATAPHATMGSPRAWFAAPRYALACRA